VCQDAADTPQAVSSVPLCGLLGAEHGERYCSLLFMPSDANMVLARLAPSAER
jgi:hypothetical protein